MARKSRADLDPMTPPPPRDPLLQPFRLKHLTLRNRVMSTAHEPAYSQDGLPKERYRLYHAEKARGGIALTMTAGSAVVSRDSPEAFGNLHAYRDEIVPWLQELSDACHEHGAAVMMQITHLGRRTNWNKADWLPVLAPSPVREPAHRTFPKAIEDWDIERIVADYADAAERLQAGGLDGLELEAYGHLLDGFWSPATNRRRDAYGGGSGVELPVDPAPAPWHAHRHRCWIDGETVHAFGDGRNASRQTDDPGARGAPSGGRVARAPHSRPGAEAVGIPWAGDQAAGRPREGSARDLRDLLPHRGRRARVDDRSLEARRAPRTNWINRAVLVPSSPPTS